MSLRDELQAIYDKHGHLDPELVVETARPKGHPLHERVFDRTKADAAETYYRDRAHRLIQSVKIVVREATEDEKERKIRRYHAVLSDAGMVYKSAEDVAADPFMRQLVLRDMEREWRQLLARYEQFEEFLGMVREDVAA